MNYFVLWFKLDYRHQYAIWCGNDRELPDKLYNKNGKVPIFQTENELRKYASTNSIELVNEEPILHNLDTVKRWLAIKGKKKIGLSYWLHGICLEILLQLTKMLAQNLKR